MTGADSMPDPWAWWPAVEIARVTKCPAANVREGWPLIADALDRRGIWDRDVARGVIATIAIETASTFKPLHEYGTPADWARYSGGAAFAGRGYVQLTHDYNYRAASAVVGVDLLAAPDRAMEPQIAAEIIAWWFAAKGVKSKDGSRWYSLPELCRAGDWEWVRRVVQGGVAGLPRLLQIVNELGGSTVPTPLPFNPDAPAEAQPNDWSCALYSTQWLMRSIGRNPGAAWLEQQLVPGLIGTDVGLRDATGAPLAAWITETYGKEMGFVAHAANVTFDDVLAGAGVNPTLIGGRRWGPGGHWAGVRRLLPDGTLELANSAPGYTGVGTSLSRAEWDARGPWTAIWVGRASVGVVNPPVVPASADTRHERALALVRQALAVLEEAYP